MNETCPVRYTQGDLQRICSGFVGSFVSIGDIDGGNDMLECFAVDPLK